MALTTLAKLYINRWLQRINLQLGTLTEEKIELKRLKVLEESGHFVQPVFPIPRVFEDINASSILNELPHYRRRFNDFEVPSHNDVGYTFDNDYFSSPDAEVLYTIVRKFQPQTIIEVGSGHSTRIIRQALLDGRLGARLISIDPCPRIEIGKLADKVYCEAIETLRNPESFYCLKERDILFIDSSHKIKTGNDVVFLYLNAISKLAPGVLIHIHDVFLPYDYPKDSVMEKRREWNEQYLVQALLMFTSTFEVLWAGHFLQNARGDFAQYFPHLNGRVAGSLWLRKIS